MLKFKLRILRVMIIVALKIIITLSTNKLKLPMRWLLHYLIGSGHALIVPKSTINACCDTISNVIKRDGYVKGSHCIDSSTLYDGRGFEGRPSLFYLVGGFTFNINTIQGRICLSGVDRYDWHPVQEGNYFTSPLGHGRLILTLVKVLAFVFGKEYFPINGFPSSEAGISNKLWEDFSLVGAREFTSHMACVLDMSLDISNAYLEGYSLLSKNTLSSTRKGYWVDQELVIIVDDEEDINVTVGSIEQESILMNVLYKQMDSGKSMFIKENEYDSNMSYVKFI